MEQISNEEIMKITVDIKEIELLNQIITELKKENQDLQNQLKIVDPQEMREQAMTLAQNIFISSFEKICEKLGFICSTNMFDIDFKQLESRLGKKWWESEKLDIKVGATLTTEFKNAFIRMGVNLSENE